MDEEGKKINLSNFFERSDSIDKKASSALSKSNSAISAISANKLLIESLQMSIETMQTQIRDIANYIIIENKLEKDEREDKLLEEQDAKQKQQMMDRALGMQGMQGVKGDKGSKGQPGEFGQQGGGGGGSFLGGLLKAIAVGGIAALALPLVPVIAPLLLKVIGGGLIVAATAAVGKQIAKALTGPIQNIGKGLQSLGSKSLEVGQKTVGGIKRGVGGVADFLTFNKFDFDKKGKSEKSSESNMSFSPDIEGGEDDTFTIKSNATLKKGKVVSGNMSQADAERNIKKLELKSQENDAIQSYGFHSPEHNEIKKKIMILDGTPEEAIYTDEKGKLKTKGYSTYGGETTVFDDKKKKDGETTVFDDKKKKDGETTTGAGRVLGGILDAVTFNKFDFDKKNPVEANDLKFKEINQLKSSVSNNSAAIQTIINPTPQTVKNTNSPVTVQNSKPQVTYTQIKTTKPAIPFINTLGNQYLSLSPHTNKLPPEIARMIQ